MREILFRGKRVDNGEWIFGDLYTGLNDEIYINTVVQLTANSRCNIQIMIQKETVGQFTGLTDNNGTKIFEGDVILINTEVDVSKGFFDEPEIKTSELIASVIWDDEFMGWDIEIIEKDHYSHGYCLMKDCMNEVEITGNIHENKDQC